jgi:hypothetical protein
MKHSIYSPSSLSRIIKCPGSVGLIDDLMITNTITASRPSSYAAHGTMLHDYLERCYNDQAVFERLNKDDQFLTQECIDYLEILIASLGHKNFMVKSESRIDLDQWGIPDVWGTLDYQVIDPIKQHIDIIDWKFGAGIPVYAEKNPQLLTYAAGALGWPTTIQTITLHIVQPAIENFSTYDLTTSELYDWIHGTLAIAINKCSNGSKEFNSGVEQCRWCEAQNHCKTRIDDVHNIAIELFEANKRLATCPNTNELMWLINNTPLIEQAIKDIRLYIQTDMLKGGIYPDLKLVRGRSNRKWIDESKTIKWLSENTEIEEFYNSKIRSPSQIEKEMGKLKQMDDFKKLYEQLEGKITLVGASDKRPAIQTSPTTIDVFKDYSV